MFVLCLSVKAKFEQGGNELLLYMFLNFGVDFPVYFGTVADISGIVGKNGVDCIAQDVTLSSETYGAPCPGGCLDGGAG